ncbi:MAG: flagellar basal body rod protein FlgB [Phycisphaerae bacterium]
MLISSLVDRGATPALVRTAVFNQARLNMIAENIANYGTPGYRAKQLDVRGFQRALRDALDARGHDVNKPFVVAHGDEVETDDAGSLRVTPSEVPVENILFHDGTNVSIERQMSELAKTGMSQDMVVTLLRGRVDGTIKAIRGRL